MAKQDPQMPGEDTPSSALATTIAHQPPMVRMAAELMKDDEIRRAWRLAVVAAESGMFKAENGKVTPAMAFTKMLIGHDLGIGPAQSLTSIDLVKGNVQLRSVLLAAFVRKSEDYDYRVAEHDEKHCTIVFLRHAEHLGTSEYSIEDAQRAGIYKADGAWGKHPKNMVFARAMSNGVKWFCPDLLGGIPVYTEADVFEGTAVDEGSGSGEPLGLDLGPDVEKVIARATELGHAGLSDRASIEVALGQQPPGYVAEWCKAQHAELDAMETGGEAPTDAEAVEVDPEALREQLNAVLDRILAEEEADADEAVMAPLYDERDRLRDLLGPDEPMAGQEELSL
jgi:hypothetical protein